MRLDADRRLEGDRAMTPRERLIVGLDVPTVREAETIVETLGEAVRDLLELL